MKKLFVAVLLTVAATAGAFAAPAKVNPTVLSSFKADFANAANVKWQIERDFIKAEFTTGTARMEAYYNADGNIIATSKSISLNEIPVNAKRSFAKKFAGYNATEAIKFTGFDETAYYISGENDKEKVILKVDENNQVSVYTKAKR